MTPDEPISLREARQWQLDAAQRALAEVDEECRALRKCLHVKEREQMTLRLEVIRLHGLVEQP